MSMSPASKAMRRPARDLDRRLERHRGYPDFHVRGIIRNHGPDIGHTVSRAVGTAGEEIRGESGFRIGDPRYPCWISAPRSFSALKPPSTLVTFV